MRIRSSALGIMLSDTSMHNNSVHKSWPISRVQCIRKRCSTAHSANLATSELISKLANHCPAHVALGTLSIPHSTDLDPRKKKLSSWLVLPFHPLWGGSGLTTQLKRVYRFWKHSLVQSDECIDDLRVSIAWSLGARNLES